jgi:hypothetical protein
MAPISRKEERELRIERVEVLASKGWKQPAIAKELGYSQQQISLDLKTIRERSRELLRDNHRIIPIHYNMVLVQLQEIRADAWRTLSQTADVRSKAQLYNVLKDVNLNILEVLSVGDILSTEIQNRELMIKETKEQLDQLKDEISSSPLEEEHHEEEEDYATAEEENEGARTYVCLSLR